jgi:hypothetical protein
VDTRDGQAFGLRGVVVARRSALNRRDHQVDGAPIHIQDVVNRHTIGVAERIGRV